MDEHGLTPRSQDPFDNPLILDCVFSHLPLGSLCSCRLVNRLWRSAATIAVKKSLKTRLLLCADTKCTAELKKFVDVFEASVTIPYSKAILILDHLPSPNKLETEHVYKEGEMELLLQLSELFSDHFKARPPEPYTSLFKDVPPRGRNGETVKYACDLFAGDIENLIINLTLHQEDLENIEYWLKRISFPNLSELSFHITRTSPENISQDSFQATLNSMPNLQKISIRKLTKKGDQILNSILMAVTKKSHLCRLQQLAIEAFTDDKTHLEILLEAQFYLQQLSMIYLGGEVRFIEKMELIKQFLRSVSKTLQNLYTHLPLFSSDQRDFPRMTSLKTLKIEKVYREFAFSQSQLFSFNFNKYFPNIERIIFKDYDLWKNMQLKTFPLQEVIPCPKIVDISLPDLCFDAPLMERYFMKFPNLRKLSIVVSYVNRYQRQCSFCMVYAFLPLLKELSVSLFEMDLLVYDHIFTGISEEKCRELLQEGRNPEETERGLSITMLKNLENLKISSLHGKKTLGISDLSVTFAFLEMQSLRHFSIEASLITQQGIAEMAKKFDVVTVNRGPEESSTLHDMFLCQQPVIP